jgi:hypothetical protein
VVAAHSLWHQSSETAASFASVQIQAPEAPGRKLSAEEDALLAEPRGPCKKRRGAPVKMSIELKNAALAAKDGGGTNKGVAKILYNTSYPTAQQVRNAAKHISLLRKKRMDGASRVPTRTE